MDAISWRALMAGSPVTQMNFTDANETVDCNSIPRPNATLVITDAFQGIPQNLVINLVVWVLLLLLFAILRKKAWNYGRLALVQRTERRKLLHVFRHYNAWTQLFYGDVDGAPPNATVNGLRDPEDVTLRVDKGFFSWITAIFRVKDRHILQRSGPDTIQYLSFQRHLIAYVAFITLVSVIVVLPINLKGNLGGDIRHFGHTTMSNLDPYSPLLWIHVVLSVFFLPVGVYVMRRFSVSLKFDEEAAVSRTLMITDIPKDACTKRLILHHFEEAYPEFIIQDIQLAYNIKEVIRLDRRREAMYEAKLWSEEYLRETNERLIIYPCLCSWTLSCCNGDKDGCCGFGRCPISGREDAITYYAQREASYIIRLDKQKLLSMERPLGICFITLLTVDMATKVRHDHEHTCKCGVSPPTSSVTMRLEPYRWSVTSAPLPNDIYWENLNSHSEHWYLRSFCINFFMFVVLFFLTTPFVVITSLDVLNIVDIVKDMSPLMYQFLPTLLLWTVAALMPVLVSYSDQFVRHWTRSSENHTVMRKTFIFLLFMIIILPSLGLTSAKAFVEWAVKSKGKSMRWECVFLPDNGVFYVNYVVTSAFIGTALELIRFPELFLYVVQMCSTRSIAERPSVRKAILCEFPFGIQYAWFLLIFAATVIYSLSCPLITPFGMVYLVLKHCVDRHNIIFAYGPSKISAKIHATAINFVVASILLLQLMILFFIVMRRGVANMTIFSAVFFCISALMFVGQLFFNKFKGFSPIYTNEDGGLPHDAESTPSNNVQFYPSVLSRERMAESSQWDGANRPRQNLSVTTQRSYGSTVSPNAVEDRDPSASSDDLNRLNDLMARPI